MVKQIMFIIILILISITTCLSQTEDELIAMFPTQLKDNFKILVIHTVNKKQIIKHIKDYNKWKGIKKNEVPKLLYRTYFLEVSDTLDKYSYMIVSQKVETESKEMIKIGNVYEMELTMFEYEGLSDWGQTYVLMNGVDIPIPRTGWADRVYVTPNLQGLYYVKPEQKDGINSE